eukprot:3555052-Pleurochrysis_carterae.AAC.2
MLPHTLAHQAGKPPCTEKLQTARQASSPNCHIVWKSMLDLPLRTVVEPDGHGHKHLSSDWVVRDELSYSKTSAQQYIYEMSHLPESQTCVERHELRLQHV